MKHFGANITSLKLSEFQLSINLMVEWLHQLPELESLSFAYGKIIIPAVQNAIMPSLLSNLKSLEIRSFDGLSDIVNLIPAGALNSYCCHDNIEQSTEAAKILKTILAKQHNIKSLRLYDCRDPSVLCLDQLQLDTLLLGWDGEDASAEILNDKLVDVLKCQTNLKQLRLITHEVLRDRVFNWFCTNLKKLEVLEVGCLDLAKGCSFRMFSELKNLRHFRTYYLDCLGRNAFQVKSDSLAKLKITDCRLAHDAGERLNRTVHSLLRSFINLTHLEMAFDDFDGIISVLSHCTTLIDLRSQIRDPSPNKLIRQRFPNIQYLELSDMLLKYSEPNDIDPSIDQILVIIVQAMPNLKGLSLEIDNLTFDMNTIKEFVSGSPSLDYLYVNYFNLFHVVSSTADIVETIRCLLDPLQGYQLIFQTTHERKYELANEFYVRSTCRSDMDSSTFQLRKGEVKKFYKNL